MAKKKPIDREPANFAKLPAVARQRVLNWLLCRIDSESDESMRDPLTPEMRELMQYLRVLHRGLVASDRGLTVHTKITKKKIKKAPSPKKTYPVVVQEWEESERGWGVRPDGASLHLSTTDAEAFIAAYWAREKANNPSGETPEEYSRPSGSTYVLEVDLKTYKQIKKTMNGMYLLDNAFRRLRDLMSKSKLRPISNQGSRHE